MSHAHAIWHDMLKASAGPPGPVHVSGPPCSDCVHWRPELTTWVDGKMRVLELCRSTKQRKDFSCYQESPVGAPPSNGA